MSRRRQYWHTHRLTEKAKQKLKTTITRTLDAKCMTSLALLYATHLLFSIIHVHTLNLKIYLCNRIDIKVGDGFEIL